MTTSGTSTFNYTRDQIINSAARKIGAIAAGEALGSNALTDFSDQLNIMVKGWDASGLHIWTEEEATLFIQPNQVQYTIGGSTTDNAALTTFFSTTVAGSGAPTGASTVQVASSPAANFGNGFFIGIVLNSGTIFWTTEVGNPVGGVVTLAATFPSAAANGNAVYVYQTQITRPLRIVGARRFTFNGAIDTPMILMSRLDYRNLPNKASPGTPTQLFYDPRGGANNQGQVFIWPAPQDLTFAIKFTWWRMLQDFSSPANNPDLPNEWINALIWNLAYQMSPEYDVPPQRFAMLKEMAQGSLELVMGWDREPESYLFGFNTDQTGPGY